MSQEVKTLQELAGEWTPEIQAFLDQVSHPSIFENYESFQVLNLRRITLSSESLSFSSVLFLVKDKEAYFTEANSPELNRLKGGLSEMHAYLERFYRENQRIINGYSDEIETLEGKLFERSVPTYFMDMWFDLKRDLAKIENFYYRNAVVYKEFYRTCEDKFGRLKDDFQDIEDMINFHNANIFTLKTRMDSLHHYFVSIKSDRLNKTLLMLTLISGVFLPLNLIVGFFGMNTEGLFLKSDPQGTQTVLYILAAIVAVSLLGLPLFKFLDKHILRFFLGRYNFYRSIRKRIGKLDDHLKA